MKENWNLTAAGRNWALTDIDRAARRHVDDVVEDVFKVVKDYGRTPEDAYQHILSLLRHRFEKELNRRGERRA